MILHDAGAEIAGPCRSVAEALAMIQRSTDIAAAVLDVRLGRETIGPVKRTNWRVGQRRLCSIPDRSATIRRAEWRMCKVITKPAEATAITTAIAEMVMMPACLKSSRIGNTVADYWIGSGGSHQPARHLQEALKPTMTIDREHQGAADACLYVRTEGWVGADQR
jgi:hypothetical protein